ncbi:hypothetical protein HYQ46_008795 [Verticillium longisporum]|nr:hypothetical protein HYQ46_008795 [Verticillium longisporum]
MQLVRTGLVGQAKSGAVGGLVVAAVAAALSDVVVGVVVVANRVSGVDVLGSLRKGVAIRRMPKVLVLGLATTGGGRVDGGLEIVDRIGGDTVVRMDLQRSSAPDAAEREEGVALGGAEEGAAEAGTLRLRL